MISSWTKVWGTCIGCGNTDADCVQTNCLKNHLSILKQMSKAVTYQHIGPTSPPSLKHQQSVDQDMNWHSWKDQAKHEQFTNCRGQKVRLRMSKFEWSLEKRLFCLWPPWNNMENKNDDFSGYPQNRQASTVRSWNWMIGLALVAPLVGPCISICQCMSTISYHDLFNSGNRSRSLQSCSATNLDVSSA